MPTCRICNTSQAAFGTKHSWFDGKDYEYFKCPACGFICVLPFPGYEVYNDAYYAGKGPDPFVDYESEYTDYQGTYRTIEFEDVFRIVRNVRGDDRRPCSWLDFGCGAGGFLKFLQAANAAGNLGMEISGHDIGTYARRLSDDGHTIHSLEQLQALEGAFDVITCIEVVEHVYETDQVFALLARLLKPGGILILTTGNLASFAARKAGINYRYLMPEIHISLFTPKALWLLYERNGLAPFNVRYSGVVRFKVVKSLKHPLLKALARLALHFPPLVRLIDTFYGVSAMPCARKPVPPSQSSNLPIL